MFSNIQNLPTGKKIYFASDFHLGVPDKPSSLAREKKIVRWLKACEKDAAMVVLVGDIFDFWFEYKHAIPKGYVRLLGQLAQMTDNGIAVVFFTGNHDMWMFDYFPEELNIPVLKKPQEFTCNGKKFLIAHGDGLGPEDYTYKFLKKIFANRICQWLFHKVHPDIGIGLAAFWSRRSRIANTENEEKFEGDGEWLLQYCRRKEKSVSRDYYIFGHRHLPLDVAVNDSSRYINLGEWVNYYTYAVFDGNNLALKTFES